MTLLSSLNTALSSLRAQMSALQTAGHNIANATTPGYSRQRVELETNIARNFITYQLGTGVRIKGVQRIVDNFLEASLQNASSKLGQLGVRQDTLERLEGMIQGSSESSIGTQLDKLFSALSDLSARPEDISARVLVLEQADSLSASIRELAENIKSARESLNDQLKLTIEQVNRITSEIASLNKEIVKVEGAGTSPNAANDLRDRRGLLTKQLAEYLDLRAVEAPNGELNILVGGTFLVNGTNSYALTTQDSVDKNSVISTVVMEDGGAINIKDGKIAGIINARDEDLRSIMQDLDALANSIILEFNKVQSTGQGLKRLSDITSNFSLSRSDSPISITGSVTSVITNNTIIDTSLIGSSDLTGQELFFISGENYLERREISSFDSSTGTITLDKPLGQMPKPGDAFQITSLYFPITNGSFDFVLTDEVSGIQTKTNITVDLDKISPDTTLEDIRDQINAINPNISASITPDNRLRIQSLSGDLTFSFSNDTSGFLASIGLNQFFDGYSALNIKVNDNLMNNSALLSTGTSNIKGDNTNALAFIDLRGLPLVKGEATFEEFYRGILGTVGVDTAEFKERLENQKLLSTQLENQRERVSGVNIDEEAVNMLTNQRAYQASARLIAVVDSMLEILMSI
jgi:flagellar hook-associated protein 1 FlgK